MKLKFTRKTWYFFLLAAAAVSMLGGFAVLGGMDFSALELVAFCLTGIAALFLAAQKGAPAAEKRNYTLVFVLLMLSKLAAGGWAGDLCSALVWPALLGIEYSTVDDGWEERPDKWKFLHELAGYAQSRGVGLFVWRHWEKLNDPADDYRQMRGFLDSVAAVGIKGVKVDFMNGEGIRQIDFNTHLLKNAARRRLLVNPHGCQKPTGEIRTYPNEITREGVRGIELNRITANYEKRMRDEGRTPDPDRYVPGDENQNIPASHNAALPFTRGVLGAADYTPVAFTMPGGTTAAHQLAFALLLDSPLLTIAENPFVLSGDERYRPALDIIRRLPTVWDETVVLPQSEIGRLAVIARRKGGTWYIAGVNTAPTAVTIPAGLIPATARKAQIVRDAADGSLQTTEVALPAPEPLSVQLPENGGFIAVLE